jgi:hypothetical protein
MNLATAWVTLEAENSRQAGIVSRRLDSPAPCGLLAAIEQPGSVRALLIEVPVEAVGTEPWPRARGFDVHPVLLSGGVRGSVQLQLRCGDRAWGEVFVALTIDLVQRLEQETTAHGAVAALHQRLAIWQAFFQRQAPEGLTPEEQRGLFGELTCLRKFLLDGWETSPAIRAWQGPLGGAQDFVAKLAVEVKASLVDSPPRIRISSAQQLTQPAGLELLLWHVQLAAHDAGEESLPALAASVGSIVGERDASSITAFLDRLQAAGYLATEADKYPTRYSVQEQTFYRVADGFPRIVPDDLISGVVGVQYAIETTALLPFRIEEPEAVQLIGA